MGAERRVCRGFHGTRLSRLQAGDDTALSPMEWRVVRCKIASRGHRRDFKLRRAIWSARQAQACVCRCWPNSDRMAATIRIPPEKPAPGRRGAAAPAQECAQSGEPHRKQSLTNSQIYFAQHRLLSVPKLASLNRRTALESAPRKGRAESVP